jgi:hypothetical protein
MGELHPPLNNSAKDISKEEYDLYITIGEELGGITKQNTGVILNIYT